MSATVVEKITPQPYEPRDITRRNLSATRKHFSRWRWGLFVAIACVIALTVLFGFVQKLLWMRELDYAGIFWTLLSVKWGMFGVALVFHFFICGSISALQPRASTFHREHVPSLEGYHCVSLRQSRCCLRRCTPENQRRFKSQGIDVGQRCSRHVRFPDIRGWCFHAMGHVSPLSLWRIVRR